MRFALAFAGVVLLAGRTRAWQIEAKRSEEPRAKLVVRVVAPKPAAAPLDVEVRVVPVAGFAPEAQQDESSIEHLERGRLAAKIERARAVTAKIGESVAVPRPAGPIVVVASTPGLWSEAMFDEEETGPVEIMLHEDHSFAIRVVDERGRRVAGVPVAIASHYSSSPITEALLDPETSFLAIATTREADGDARFDHVQEWIRSDDGSFALLAVPNRDHEQFQITTKLLEAGGVDLRAPPFGSVEIRLSGVPRATVSLRERPGPPPPDEEDERTIRFGEWRPNEPLALEVVDGLARWDRVGIGCTLEVEVRWNGLLTPLHAEFAGPKRPGENASWSLVPEGLDPRSLVASLEGRAVDAHRRPIASRVLRGRIVKRRQDIDLFDERFGVVTDQSGRFELELGPREPSPSAHRWLEILESEGDHERSGLRGWIELSDGLTAGAHDLGDLMLVGADAKSRIGSLDDAELLAEVTTAQTWPPNEDWFTVWVGREKTLDLRLNEMARRGGPRFVTFFEQEIARQRDEATREHEAEADWTFAVDWKWAALLRRAQRRPAPIALEAAVPVCEAITPKKPDLKVRIHAIDKGFERIAVPLADSDRWRTTVFDREGRVVDEPPFDCGFVNEISFGNPWTELGFDQSIAQAVSLGRRFDDARPGDYRVRVELLIDDEPALTSGDLIVRIRPVPIRVSRRDYDAMVGWIRAIDVTKPVPLTNAPIAPDDEFIVDAERPEDRLARCGRLALPALLDELTETTADVRRRAWILGLLWDTQVANSITVDQIEGAVGVFEWSHRWPTVQPHGEDHGSGALLPGGSRRNDCVPRDAAPDPRVQRDLAAIWTELRAWFEFTIEE